MSDPAYELYFDSEIEFDIETVDSFEFDENSYIPVINGGVDIYAGTYEVTPKVTPQSLLTANKLLEDDISIHGIPTYETSNQYGTTFIIGEM